MEERKLIDASLFRMKLVGASEGLEKSGGIIGAMVSGAFQSIIELLDEFPTAKQADLWINTENKMPPDGKTVVCRTRIGYEVMTWKANSNGWESDATSRMYNLFFVTHWMELPKLPDDAKESWRK